MARPVTVLAITDPRPTAALRGFLRGLNAGGAFAVESAPAEALTGADGHDVILGASERPLRPEQAEALAGKLRAGGSLLALAGCAAAWRRDPEIAALLPWEPIGLTPVAELVVRARGGHPITDRLDPETMITDRLMLSTGVAESARLLTVPWRYEEHVLAFELPAGRGRIVHLGLGFTDEVYEEPFMRRLVFRALRHLGEPSRARPASFGVGLLGYGAIGKEHAQSAAAVTGLRLAAVCDRAPARLAAAREELDVPSYDQPDGLLADPAVDVVVVGTPPSAHAEPVLAALAAGKHVVCEKPFALRTEEVRAMVEAAAKAELALTVYQSRRWDPDFEVLRRAVRQGRIGEPFYMESFIGGFGHPCNYWHSHEPISGGTIYDWGSHYFDWQLQLFEGSVRWVSASAHKRVWHDVTNADQVRVDVEFEGGAQATFLQSDIAAVLKPKWYLLGTRGALLGDWRFESVKARHWSGSLVEETLAPAESPADLRLLTPDGAGGTSEERLALPPRATDGFYRNLADHLILGETLAVQPAEAGRTVAIMEAATRSIARGGARLRVTI